MKQIFLFDFLSHQREPRRRMFGGPYPTYMLGIVAGLFSSVLQAQTLQTRNYTTGCKEATSHSGSAKPSEVKAGEVKVVAPGSRFELSAYGFEMGFHCSEDHGTFAWREFKGDFDVVVRVDSLFTENGKHHTRGGIMVRKLPIDGNQIFVNVAVASNYTEPHYADLRHFAARLKPSGKLYSGNSFQYHVHPESTLFPQNNTARFPRNFPNEWLRLKRSGDRVYGYFSRDGVTWLTHRRWNPAFQEGPDNSYQLDLGETVALGLYQEGSPERNPSLKSTGRYTVVSGLFPELQVSLSRAVAPSLHKARLGESRTWSLSKGIPSLWVCRTCVNGRRMALSRNAF